MPSWPPDFLSDLAFVLAREGGYVDDPEDPGGATNQGVTQRVYDRDRRRRGLASQDVRQISADEVRSLYWRWYYEPATAGGLTGARALVAFDTAVNMGVGVARRLVAESGTDLDRLIELRRLEYHHIVAEHPVLRKFLPGWLQRLRALRKHLALPPSVALEADFRAQRPLRRKAA